MMKWVPQQKEHTPSQFATAVDSSYRTSAYAWNGLVIEYVRHAGSRSIHNLLLELFRTLSDLDTRALEKTKEKISGSCIRLVSRFMGKLVLLLVVLQSLALWEQLLLAMKKHRFLVGGRKLGAMAVGANR
jgi:hypothetical protein